MYKLIVDNHIPFVLMGSFVATGVVSKLIVSVTLKKMVRAASDMGKSSHALMRLVRAKFEHACMVSDKVQNVEVFARKYLYEYKVFGVRLRKFQRIETGSAWLCLLIGLFGAFAAYQAYGMTEQVLRIGATGAVEAILLFLLHRTTDEKYQLEAVRTYMVDYLENVCARRCEKAAKREEKPTREEIRHPETVNPQLTNPERPRPANEVPSPLPEQGISEPAMPDPMPLPGSKPQPVPISEPVVDTNAVIKAAQKKQAKQEEKKDKKQVPKEVMIREILEEFLA